jgi:hypothetical protein
MSNTAGTVNLTRGNSSEICTGENSPFIYVHTPQLLLEGPTENKQGAEQSWERKRRKVVYSYRYMTT